MTEIKQLEYDKKNGKLSFYSKGIEIPFSNAIRRAVIDGVPTIAIEEVEFRKNTSVLYDEIIAHRLGLLALKTDLKAYNLPSKCKCEGNGCARCQLKMSLKANGPYIVYASDLKSKDPKIKPAYPETPIVKLLKGQNLELEATAILGQGEEHSKWSPGIAHYKQAPTILIEKSKCDGCNICVEQCSQDVLEIKNKKAVIKEKNLLSCHLCLACEENCPKAAIKIEKKPNELIFFVESWGQLDCKEIIETAADLMREQCEEFQKLIAK